MADCFQHNTGLSWDFNKKHLPKNFQYLYINYCISNSYTSLFFTLYHFFDARDSAAGSLKLVNSSNETFTKNKIPAPVANASNKIRFTLRGFGTIVATDNGNPADFVPFPSQERAAFSGCALAIIKGQKNKPGTLIVQADSPGLKTGSLKIFTR